METSERLKVFFSKPQNIALLSLIALLLFISGRYDYLVFHTVVEGLAVIVAIMIYILTATTYKYSQNSYLLFLGIAALFIAIMDSLHLMTYKGVGIFPIDTPNTATQLWIAGRYMEGITLLLATFFIKRDFPYALVFGLYAIITAVLIAMIMGSSVFPDCYVVGQGLTRFKVVSEYIISIIILVAIIRIHRIKMPGNRLIYDLMKMAMTFTILSELSFTLYIDVYGIMNGLGHIFKFISYSLLFTGVVFLGVEDPYRMISEQLKVSANMDRLTGLYNRRGFEELFQREHARAKRENRIMGVMMMDLDNFKGINDGYGHKTGDEVLNKFASILLDSIRGTDIVCRMGGDEFLILANEDYQGMAILKYRIIDNFQNWTDSDIRFNKLGVSTGIAIWDPFKPCDMDDLIIQADKEMYKEKDLRKRSTKIIMK